MLIELFFFSEGGKMEITKETRRQAQRHDHSRGFETPTALVRTQEKSVDRVSRPPEVHEFPFLNQARV